MKRREFCALLGGAAAAMPWAAGAESARSAPPTVQRLVGAWKFVSIVNTREDGSTFSRWGPQSRGLLMFDAAGNFSQIITGSESFLFGSKNFCAFGTYSFEEDGKAIVVRIEGSSISRLNGAVQRRVITALTADELRYANLATASGTRVDAAWTRSK